MVAIIENYQTPEGNVTIPEVLRPYMEGWRVSRVAEGVFMKEIFLAILKILGFLLMLPLIIASIIAFQTQILSLPVGKEAWVLWGAGRM